MRQKGIPSYQKYHFYTTGYPFLSLHIVNILFRLNSYSFLKTNVTNWLFLWIAIIVVNLKFYNHQISSTCLVRGHGSIRKSSCNTCKIWPDVMLYCHRLPGKRNDEDGIPMSTPWLKVYKHLGTKGKDVKADPRILTATVAEVDSWAKSKKALLILLNHHQRSTISSIEDNGFLWYLIKREA